MLNIALIHYYASLVEKKVKKLEEIPEDIREYVEKYLNGEDIISPNIPSGDNKEEEKEYKLGAIHLSPITKEIPKEFNDNDGNEVYIKIPLDVDEIFTDEILDGKPKPENVKYELLLYEFQFYYTEDDVFDVQVENDELSITGSTDLIFTECDKFIRCDIKITSSNYEM